MLKEELLAKLTETPPTMADEIAMKAMCALLQGGADIGAAAFGGWEAAAAFFENRNDFFNDLISAPPIEEEEDPGAEGSADLGTDQQP